MAAAAAAGLLRRPSAHRGWWLGLGRHSSWGAGARPRARSMTLGSARRVLSSWGGGGGAAATPWTTHAGEGAVLLRFGTTIDLDVNERVLACLGVLSGGGSSAGIGGAATTPGLECPRGVREVLPAYASLLVHFDPLTASRADVERWCLEGAALAAQGGDVEAPRVVTIPVRYGGEGGPDVEAAAKIAGMSSAEVIEAHSSAEYHLCLVSVMDAFHRTDPGLTEMYVASLWCREVTVRWDRYRVYFLGFTGGFPYLGGLPASLKTVPRLDTPRQAVPKGSVGIAAGQTGVYPLATPGGWYLLGKSDVEIFDATQDPPALLAAGDVIKFVSADGEQIPAKEPEAAAVMAAPEIPWVEVLSPGPLTTVQVRITRAVYMATVPHPVA